MVVTHRVEDTEQKGSEKMEKIKQQILRMTDNLEKDVARLRESNSEQLIGSEIMAVNALCNAAKTLKEIESQKGE